MARKLRMWLAVLFMLYARIPFVWPQGQCAQTPVCTFACTPPPSGRTKLLMRSTAYTVCFNQSVSQNFGNSASLQTGASVAASNWSTTLGPSLQTGTANCDINVQAVPSSSFPTSGTCTSSSTMCSVTASNGGTIYINRLMNVFGSTASGFFAA